MFDFPLVIVDIETTGASNRHSRIIEVAALRVEGGEIVDTFESLVNPGIRIPNFITALTTINDQTITSAPFFGDIAEEFAAFLDGATFMAHNVNFDYSFIKRELAEAGFVFNAKTLCSVKLSRRLYKEHRSHSLESIIHRHGILVDSRHRAMQDARAVYDFLLMARRDKGDDAFNEAIQYQLRNSSLPENLSTEIIDEAPSTPGVYIFKDSGGRPIYIGKSMNIRNRIRSHFSQAKTQTKEHRISEMTHDIETVETSSEIEALLLESRLIKQHLPVHNVRLRRKKEQVVVVGKENSFGYIALELSSVNVNDIGADHIAFGVFNTRTQARSSFNRAMDEYQLCAKLLSIEKGSGPCFGYQIDKCRGACISDEPPEEYNERISAAFEKTRLANWSYSGPVEVFVSPHRKLLVDHWKIVGTIEKQEERYESEIDDSVFDLDSYKILRSYFCQFPDRVVPIP